MLRIIIHLCFFASLNLPAACKEFCDEGCADQLNEPTGDLNLLQASVRAVVSDKTWPPSGQQAGQVPCNNNNTVWDIGFFDGSDARSYLDAGFCVLAVEADPTLVASAQRGEFAAPIASQRLTLLNMALAPEAAPGEKSHGEMSFYMSKCKKEWNSFLRTVGCRACAPPHNIDEMACDEQEVSSKQCGELFKTYGTPRYVKLDIEGAESGCFAAMRKLPEKELPEFVSAEASSRQYIDAMYDLGYRRFKMVRQDTLIESGHSTTGPWGNDARDCRTGLKWRTYKEIREEMVRSRGQKTAADIGDPCPIGVEDIRKEGKGTVWFDIHATF